MRRKIDYLFQRPGSRNWWLRLQGPDRRTERSLGTPDRVQAEILALPEIAKHKASLLALRPHLQTSWRRTYEPGLHDGPDGGRIAATVTELSHYDAGGKLLRTEPNGGPTVQLVGNPLTVRTIAEAFLNADLSALGDGFDAAPRRNKAPIKGGDDAILETYLAHNNITGYYEREARDTWATFRSLCDKPLKDCDRDDGRKLVAFYMARGSKSATIRKRIGWLRAAVNFAIDEGHLKFNPFIKVVPKREDELEREKFTDADVRTIKRNLHRLDKNDQLLIRLLATTGMRLAEAYEIGSEKKEGGARYCIVGTKTEQSERRVPFPGAVLSLLPKKITGPLFKRDAADPESAASKRLNRFLNDIGITDPAKVIHSFRHRAQDRLRAAKCPQEIRWEILGHEKKTVAAGYGEGHPVPMLREWIDKIGF
jgi:integrase